MHVVWRFDIVVAVLIFFVWGVPKTAASWCSISWLWWAPAATRGCPCPSPWAWCRVRPAPPVAAAAAANRAVCTRHNLTTTPSMPPLPPTRKSRSSPTGPSVTAPSASSGKPPAFFWRYFVGWWGGDSNNSFLVKTNNQKLHILMPIRWWGKFQGFSGENHGR